MAFSSGVFFWRRPSPRVLIWRSNQADHSTGKTDKQCALSERKLDSPHSVAVFFCRKASPGPIGLTIVIDVVIFCLGFRGFSLGWVRLARF